MAIRQNRISKKKRPSPHGIKDALVQLRATGSQEWRLRRLPYLSKIACNSDVGDLSRLTLSNPPHDPFPLQTGFEGAPFSLAKDSVGLNSTTVGKREYVKETMALGPHHFHVVPTTLARSLSEISDRCEGVLV